ncbi:DUF3613 domain-containing protein [uncultured Pseudacidovorax sp.]|uniref:DUF3613 domain-containing protein n=1 Tax=uncultured Pseudacidovorax sp. TaxID=679313 RepID=UPI0025CB8367|nr:DUF3613 domain-containing protein [uncultured Pseudacidovorax sp.]
MTKTTLLSLLLLGTVTLAPARAQTPSAASTPPPSGSRQVMPVQVQSVPATAVQAPATSAPPGIVGATASAETPAATDQAALPVGAATQRLLALQRDGTLASATPRPIPGEVAHRSYERYLSSFNHPIPDRYGSSVSVRPGATGASTSTGLGR